MILLVVLCRALKKLVQTNRKAAWFVLFWSLEITLAVGLVGWFGPFYGPGRVQN